MPPQASPITPATFAFFRALARNNRTEWMQAHRDDYVQHLVEPMRALLAQLTPVVLKLDPNFEVAGRTNTNFSRINRDIRFAKDKSPYRMHMYLMFPRRGSDDGAQLFVGVAADVVTVGFRVYSGGRDLHVARVTAPRAAANTKWLARQAARLGRKYQTYWYATEKGDWVQKNNWPKEPEEWKRLKGWVVRRKYTPAAAARPAFVGEVTRVFRDVFPLHRFVSATTWKP